MPTIEGRLVVFMIQKDLEPSRIVGLMRLLIDARPFFAAFTPRDRVAVLSFDSRLRIGAISPTTSSGCAPSSSTTSC